ncbi:MAG TPA: hypothetical protein VF362_03185, partial [Demequinaceae bacterium]
MSEDITTPVSTASIFQAPEPAAPRVSRRATAPAGPPIIPVDDAPAPKAKRKPATKKAAPNKAVESKAEAEGEPKKKA